MSTLVTKEMLYQGIVTPPGAVMSFALSAAPIGWLNCDGAAISRTTYVSLFAAIGTIYGVGDNSTTFNVPNLQGQFVRGLTTNQSTVSRDPLSATRVLGNVQGDIFKSHNHGITDPGHSHGWSAYNGPPGSNYGFNFVSGIASFAGYTSYGTGSNTTGITINNQGDLETRPVNIALLYCIKY
jgi:microcystin-dependent protein